MARPVRTSMLLTEDVTVYKNMDKTVEKGKLPEKRSEENAVSDPANERAVSDRKKEPLPEKEPKEKEKSVKEELDELLPDNFFGEFEDFFGNDRMNREEREQRIDVPERQAELSTSPDKNDRLQGSAEKEVLAEEKQLGDGKNIEQESPIPEADEKGDRNEPAPGFSDMKKEVVSDEPLEPPEIEQKPHREKTTSDRISMPELEMHVKKGASGTKDRLREDRIPEDLEPQHTVNRAVRRTYKQIGLPQPIPKVMMQQQMISVYSPKGGVGKSTIVRELAHVLSRMKRNGKRLRILVVDADWEFGDVDSTFGICPSPNVMDWVRRICKDRERLGYIPSYSPADIISRYVIEFDEQIHILAGSDNAMEAARMDPEIADAIMDNLRRCDYDLILIDNCNTLKDTTVIPLEKSDLILLILSLDTSTVQDTRNFLDILGEFRIEKSRLRMVVNQVPVDDKKCELGISHVARILNMEVSSVIHVNPDTRSFTNVGEAASSDKGSLFSKEIRTLAKTLVVVDEEPVKAEKKTGGFFRKLFGGKR